MTIASTKATIKALSPDLTVSWDNAAAEYRVSISIYAISRDQPTWKEPRCAAKAEAIAYYTNDSQDAVDTAAVIQAHFALHGAGRPKVTKVAKRSVEGLFASGGRFL